jgi:hypothetical protein
MNLLKERKAIDAALDDYRAMLDNIPDGLFNETPPGGGWSYAEVYSHVLKATLSATIAVERCSNGTAAPTSKGLTLIGKYMMLVGSFPPVKVKVPESIDAKIPAENISREDAKNYLVKCRKRVDSVFPMIKNSSPNARSGHPHMGMLNASHWFKFIRLHLCRHLTQIKRIEKKFQSK